jgi:hypothetical protein
VTNIPDIVKEAEPVQEAPGANRMPISRIRINGRTQLRAACSEATVAEYAEALKAGVAFPPIVVFYDDRVLACRWLPPPCGPPCSGPHRNRG